MQIGTRSDQDMNCDDSDNVSAAAQNVCQAFIVGPNHFQNTLFAAYIETNSQWKSAVVENISLLAAGPREVLSVNTAVLYDCFDLDRTSMEANVLVKLERLPPAWSLILFNLDRQLGIEKSALEHGVHGFFYQDETVDTLLKGLAAVLGGEIWLSRRKMADVILENCFRFRRTLNDNQSYPHSLTKREVEILGLLTLGASNGVIADRLFISPHTVRTHLNNTFRKIKVASRLEASVWASNKLFHHGVA